jgi:hypothetical protein
MIVAIEIENFKGIGESQRIEFAPLTLVFGANSSGKSTIIHALHFFREVLETGNGDVDEVRATNGELRLGGFKNLVHLHEEKDRKIRIRVDFKLGDNYRLYRRMPNLKRLADIDFKEPLLQDFTTIGVEILVGTHFGVDYEITNPLVERLNLYLDNSLLVGSQATGCTISGGDEGTVANLCEINLEHPSFNRIDNKSIASVIAEKCGYDRERFEYDPVNDEYGRGVVSDTLGAIPTSESIVNSNSLDETDADEDLAAYYRRTLAERFIQFFVATIIDSTDHSIRLLSSLGHLGPIREIPERTRRLSFKTNRHSWYRGQAAWQRLLEFDPTFGLMEHKGDSRYGHYGHYELDLSRILGAPYIIERIGLWSTSEGYWSGGNTSGAERCNLEIILRDTRTHALVSLEDVGVGISQVIPVVVAAQDTTIPILFVEQPELHLHPKQQAMLGDLFAWETDNRCRHFAPRGVGLAEERTIVVETHSELFLLRLLRRIRETNNANELRNTDAPSLRSKDLKIYAVESNQDGTIFRCLPVSNSGDLIGGWPEGFFDERMDEVL